MTASETAQAWAKSGWRERREYVPPPAEFVRVELPPVIPVPRPAPERRPPRERPVPRPRAADQSWRERAACAGVTTEFFYPPTGRTPDWPLRWCAPCPVRQACLDWAVERNEHGIWGGTNESERREIRRRRRST